MYAIVGSSALSPEIRPEIPQAVLQGLKAAPGFIGGTIAWSANHKDGHSMFLFETEDQAATAAATAESRLPAGGPVKLLSIEVCEVVAHA